MVVVTAEVLEEEEVAEPLQTSLKRRKEMPKETGQKATNSTKKKRAAKW